MTAAFLYERPTSQSKADLSSEGFWDPRTEQAVADAVEAQVAANRIVKLLIETKYRGDAHKITHLLQALGLEDDQ